MYSIANVSIIWGGQVITGLADDATVVISYSEDAVLPKTGVQGEHAYARNTNNAGTVTFNLFSTSAILRDLIADARAGAEKSLMIRDATKESGFILQENNCVIIKAPDLSRGKEVGSVPVSFFVPDLNILAS